MGMGINRNIKLISPWLINLQAIIKAVPKVEKPIEEINSKYSPMCEYVLRVEGMEKSHIATVNTRAAARNLKRIYQNDKGIRVIITQYIYSGDRLKGGSIVSEKIVR